MLTRRELIVSAGAAVAVTAAPALAADDEAAAQALLAALAEERLAEAPGTATGRGLDTGPRAPLRSRLSDYSAAGRQQTAARLQRRIGDIDRLLAARIAPMTRRHIEVVRHAYASGLGGLAFPYGRVSVGGWLNSPYTVIQNVGAYIDVPRLLDADHKLETAADADAYLARLALFARALDDETARLHAAIGQRAVPPAFLIDKAIAQLRIARDGDAEKKPIVTRLAAAFPDRGALAAGLAATQIVPALDRQIAALTAQRAVAGSDAGVWRLPDGEAYYRWALEAATTTTRSPDDIHRQGLDELAELQGRMDPLLRKLGYTQGSVGARMAALGKDPRYGFPNDEAGRAAVIAFSRERIEAMRAKLPAAFAKQARGLVDIRRIPIAEEAGAAGAYGGPGSADGTIPGKFWINLRTTAIWNRFNLPTLAMHEAIPGHVWQGEYGFDLPLIRSLLHYNAFNEGWGLYAEQLADEVWLYADDPVGRLGYLQSVAFRACRLVVDTGLHAKRWTRERAIAWLAEANGQHASEVESEVDRYCSWAGQACGYKVGHSEINRLRRRAETALGARYDLRAFNDAVVGAGWMPLALLATVIDAHIAERRGAPG